MTERVDFYVLQSLKPVQRLNFACRLAEKAYLKDSSVIILSASLEEARLLDELLWTFSDCSFVPHRLCDGAAAAPPAEPVRLMTSLEAAAPADLLVNLGERLPARLERFARVAEIVDADPERRRLGRERFKAYREQKIALETHQREDSSDL